MEYEKLVDIIAEVLDKDPEKIHPNTRLVEDLGADSLDIFQIINAIEEEFDIVIDADQMDKIEFVEDAAELIKNSVRA